jgi:hypothetical protein
MTNVRLITVKTDRNANTFSVPDPMLRIMAETGNLETLRLLRGVWGGTFFFPGFLFVLVKSIMIDPAGAETGHAYFPITRISGSRSMPAVRLTS